MDTLDHSIEAIVQLFLGQLGDLGDVGVAMEGMRGVQAVPVFGFGVVALEDRVWLPAFAVEVGVVCCEAAGLAFVFLGLQPFFSRAKGGIGLAVRGLEELMSGGLPVTLLHKS